MTSDKIVDSDSHILEPADMWESYMEPAFRDRAMCIRKDEKGLEYLSIDGIMSSGYSGGALGRIAAVGKSLDWKMERAVMPYAEAAVLAPGAADPDERIKHLDREGVDITFIFPSLGLGWEAECEDPALSAAYCRAYNDWLVDFCRPHPDRLIPIAHISVRDVDEGIKELKRAAKIGMKGGFICPAPVNGIRYGHPYYDPFWATAQDLDMPITLHVVFNPNYPGRHLYSDMDNLGPEFFVEMMVHNDPAMSFTTIMGEGVFERFPKLRLNIVEVGCGWISHWVDKMDIKYETFGFDSPMKMKPSEYFQRQCWISAEPNETSIAAMAQLVGADRILWGSDWPHPEGHTEPVRKVKEKIASLSEEDQRKILGENALAMYNLKVAESTTG